MSSLLPIDWLPREDPLPPRAAAAFGDTARLLAHRMLELPDEELTGWSGVAAPELIVILGEKLPWVDGVEYFGQDPSAPALLLPTTRRPVVAASLVERAFRRRFASLCTPLLIHPSLCRVVDTSTAMPIQRAALTAWLDEQSA